MNRWPGYLWKPWTVCWSLCQGMLLISSPWWLKQTIMVSAMTSVMIVYDHIQYVKLSKWKCYVSNRQASNWRRRIYLYTPPALSRKQSKQSWLLYFQLYYWIAATRARSLISLLCASIWGLSLSLVLPIISHIMLHTISSTAETESTGYSHDGVLHVFN